MKTLSTSVGMQLRTVTLGLVVQSQGALAQATGGSAAEQQTDEIASELEEIQSAGTSPATAATASSQTMANRDPGNTFNPALSATISLLGGGTSRPVENAEQEHDGPGHLRTGPSLQEVELRASAVADPYLRADITLAGNVDEIGFEEAYLTTLFIPHVNVRAGQMKANVGRHNLLHTHAFPFLTVPLPWRVLLGAEGLSDPGVSADVLLPLPVFAEINAQVFQGEWSLWEGGILDDPDTAVDESVPDTRLDEDLVYLGHLKLLFEVGQSATVEAGATYVGGQNGFGGPTHVAGADLTVKWRPADAERYTGVDWTTEYLWADQNGAPGADRIGGFYSGIRYQFAQRWWVQGRGAMLGVTARAERAWRSEGLLAFIPSELTAVRLQYAFEDGEADDVRLVHEVFLQAIVSIGSHPVHSY